MKKLVLVLALIGTLSLISVASAQLNSSHTWGSFGNGTGQFYGMSGVAADTSGNIYVAELDNRVQKFSVSGSYITQFNIPARNIAIDSSGNIYATVNDSIQKFDSTGILLNTWGSTGTGNKYFKVPTGIALDSSRNIYVSDMENNRIQKLDSSGNYVTSWGTLGSGNGNFKLPSGIAVNGNYVYVADMGNYRIQKFDLNGNYLSSLGSKGTGNNQFNSSIAVANDSSGSIYVADYYNGRVLEYDSNFNYLTQYTGLSYPTALVVANNNLYILDSGNYQVYEYYNGTTNRLTPTITWSNPSAIRYGTALSETQLDASTSIPGSFVYTPVLGTVLNAGTHALRVAFTPTDTTNYIIGSSSVSLTVNKATPLIIWSNPASITNGTALSSTQLNAVVINPVTGNTVAGSFSYTPAAGIVLSTGTHTLHVNFTPTDATNYISATADVTINVLETTKAIPTITWSNPADIVYGTALSGTQLNASASVPGSFAYDPVSGTILGAGTQTLQTTFTPDDSTNYTTASSSVSLTVNKATPLTTWSNPADITYGTSLSETQLDASASVPGSFVYTPASGTVLSEGAHTLRVDFTPSDATNFTTASSNVSINVVNDAPVMSSSGNRESSSTKQIVLEPNNTQPLNSSEDIGNDIEYESGNKTINEDNGNKTELESGNKTIKGLQTEQKESHSIPGFEIYCGVVCLLGLFLYKRK